MNTSKIKKLYKKVQVFFKKKRTKLRDYFLKKKDAKAKCKKEKLMLDLPESRIKTLIFWITEALLAGLSLNFMLWQLAGFPISIGTVLAWSVAYYFFTAELPQFFVNCRRGVAK